MKGIVFKEPLKAIYIEKPMPEVKPGEVCLKMISAGVCGTDIQVFMGKNKFMKFPIVPLHEGVAVVYEVSPEVTGLSVGDFVSIRPIIPCMECRACRVGSNNACENFNCLGVQSSGIGDEYFCIKAEFAHKLSTNTDLDKAVLIEPFAVGVHAARRANPKGKNVFVVGGGTIGNFVAQACQLAGAAKVAISDVSDDKIEMAKKAGIGYPVNTTDISLKEAIKLAFDGNEADVIIDCVGAAFMLPQILETACKASTVVIVGNYSEPVTIDVTKIQRNELDVFGCITYTPEDFKLAIDYIEKGMVYTDGFITRRYHASEVQECMENAVQSKGKNMKTVIDFGDQQR